MNGEALATLRRARDALRSREQRRQEKQDGPVRTRPMTEAERANFILVPPHARPRWERFATWRLERE